MFLPNPNIITHPNYLPLISEEFQLGQYSKDRRCIAYAFKGVDLLLMKLNKRPWETEVTILVGGSKDKVE